MSSDQSSVLKRDLSVVFTGQARSQQSNKELSAGLLKLCGGVAKKANALYQKAPVRVAKNLTRQQAETAARKFWAAGWHVDLFAGKERVFSSQSRTPRKANSTQMATSVSALEVLPVAPKKALNTRQTVNLRRVYAENKMVSLCLPLNWALKSHLNAEAILQAGSDDEETYLIVIAQAKHSFGAVVRLQSYADAIVNAALGWVAKSSLLKPVGFNEAGRNFTAEIAGEVGPTKVHYQISTFECKKHFYTVYAWTNAARYKALRPLISAICSSFKVPEQQLASEVQRKIR